MELYLPYMHGLVMLTRCVCSNILLTCHVACVVVNVVVVVVADAGEWLWNAWACRRGRGLV